MRGGTRQRGIRCAAPNLFFHRASGAQPVSSTTATNDKPRTFGEGHSRGHRWRGDCVVGIVRRRPDCRLLRLIGGSVPSVMCVAPILFSTRRRVHSASRPPNRNDVKPQPSHPPRARDCHDETEPVECTASKDSAARGFVFALVSALLEGRVMIAWVTVAR